MSKQISSPITPFSQRHVPSRPPLPSTSPTSEADIGLEQIKPAPSQDLISPAKLEYPPSQYPPSPSMFNEPSTLAMHFFKFGFLFPPFWLCGALMLITPLRSPNPFEKHASVAGALVPKLSTGAWAEENLRTDADKEAFLAHMHRVELKWAKRCMVMSLIVGGIGLVMGVTIILVSKLSG